MRDIIYWWKTPKKPTTIAFETTNLSYEVIQISPTLARSRVSGSFHISTIKPFAYNTSTLRFKLPITYILMNSETGDSEKHTILYRNTDFSNVDNKLVADISFNFLMRRSFGNNNELIIKIDPIDLDFNDDERGEIQCGQDGFNMCLTIDGTKDSAKLTMLSYDKSTSIKPFSILYHNNTDTWWIVSKDKVSRVKNELGFLYKHELSLEGAVELLNARDLTDCAFNQNTYTIEETIRRLFSLSNFEFSGSEIEIDTGNNIDLNTKIDFIKTYENYTLLSALRDFFGGYNCTCKLSFSIASGNIVNTRRLSGCKITIIPKSGDIDLPTISFNNFKGLEELREMSKNSYGTTIVSNVDNVVSTSTKTYPSVGGAKLSSNTYDVNEKNAIIKLPTKVFDVEEVKMHMTLSFGHQQYYGGEWHLDTNNLGGRFNVADTTSISTALNIASQTLGITIPQRTQVINKIRLLGTVSFKNGAIFNPQTRMWKYNDDTRMRYVRSPNYVGYIYIQTLVADKETANSTPEVPTTIERGGTYSDNRYVIKYDRGSDEISGFEFLEATKYVRLVDTDYGKEDYVLYEWNVGTVPHRLIINTIDLNNTAYISIQQFSSNPSDKRKVLFTVKYTPMTDLKIKIDNHGDDNNTNFYNQNGKLTDINAFSKLLDSYKNEIEGENITKYSFGFDIEDMPKLGQIVYDNGIKYVINTCSYNFFPHEDDNYYIYAEYSLSEFSSVKSILTSPNTNIRDYGIPQTNNIARKQVYRDFYELSFEYENNEGNYYQPLSTMLNFSMTANDYKSHKAIFKLTYDEEVNGQTEYYYTLESAVYKMKKAIYEVIEFKDNNIIGYDSQNTDTGFDISRVFSGTYEFRNIPISYVDSKGRFSSIAINFCSETQVSNIYREYKSTTAYATDNSISYQNYLIFIPQELFDIADRFNMHDFNITDENYKKDALEVPVFEYCCQLDDTENVEIGQDVFEDYDGKAIIYDFAIVDKNTTNPLNAGNFFEEIQDISGGEHSGSENYDTEFSFTTGNVVATYDNNEKIKLTFYRYREFTYYVGSASGLTYLSSYTSGSVVNESELVNKDIVIYKRIVKSMKLDNGTPIIDYENKLVMIIHGPSEYNIENNSVILYINHWRLK